MKKRLLALGLAAVLGANIAGTSAVWAADKVEITNVSYDPTRELYEQYNKVFAEHWKEQTGQEVEVTQSHGGSGKQALEVVQQCVGLGALASAVGPAVHVGRPAGPALPLQRIRHAGGRPLQIYGMGPHTDQPLQ